MRNARLFVLVLFFASTLLVSACITQLPPQKSDLSISVLKLSPASTATLATGEKITVTLRYSFSTPRTLRIWAKPTGNLRAIYESSERIQRGEGKLTRYVFLQEPGKLDYIKIDAKDIHGRRLYQDFYKVDYTYTFDPQKAHLKGDGIGSFVSNISLSRLSPATLRAGTRVRVKMDYEVNTEHGVALSVIPSSTCCSGYQTSVDLTGSGSTSRSFTVGGPAHVDRIIIYMTNTVGEEVYRKVIPVDYTYK